MRYLTLGEVLQLYVEVMNQSGGAVGIRDLNALESSIAQPRMTLGGNELYPNFVDKAAALAYSLVMSHPFLDGNKRIGHASLETFLVLNGYEISAKTDEQEQVFLKLAAGELSRAAFLEWLQGHTTKKA